VAGKRPSNPAVATGADRLDLGLLSELDERQLLKDGVAISLRPRAFDLLAALGASARP
jgi:hypothetical protein